MPVRTRRMINSGKGAIIQEWSSSLNEDNEMSPPAKSMVDELRTWMDNRLQEWLEALNENVQLGPTMVQTDTTNIVVAPNFEWPKRQNEKIGTSRDQYWAVYLEYCYIGQRNHTGNYNTRHRNGPWIWQHWRKLATNWNSGYQCGNTCRVPC